MKVLVTGGTGFVGALITADLIHAGHDVRLLVRRREQVPMSLAPYDVMVEDLVVGDVLDEDVVRKSPRRLRQRRPRRCSVLPEGQPSS
jgi:dihydroflavonol-4-reductase